jgi:hypothetical protein
MGWQERLKRRYTSTGILASYFTIQLSSRQNEANLYSSRQREANLYLNFEALNKEHQTFCRILNLIKTRALYVWKLSVTIK